MVSDGGGGDGGGGEGNVLWRVAVRMCLGGEGRCVCVCVCVEVTGRKEGKGRM